MPSRFSGLDCNLSVILSTAGLIAVACLACAPNPVVRPLVERQSLYFVGAEEFNRVSPGENLLIALGRLRPHLLAPVGRLRGLSVVLDGMVIGEPDVLRSFPATSVNAVRYLSAADAAARFGYRVGGPVLLIELKRP
jgi:hypothetical protein